MSKPKSDKAEEPQNERIRPPRPLDAREREGLERLAVTNPLVRRALDAYDIDRARLTALGSDLVSGGGGYSSAWAEVDRMGEGGVFVSRSNIRQAIDALEEYLHSLHEGGDKPWWEDVNEYSDKHNTQDPEASETAWEKWDGPKETSRGENFTRLWKTDEAIERMADWGQFQMDVWRHEHGKNMRLAHLLGIPMGQDTDDWLAENHAAVFGPDFKERLEKARKKLERKNRARR